MDDIGGSGRNATSTVAMDFGHVTLRPDLSLPLSGIPGGGRYRFRWDDWGDLARGALGAVVLADTRRLADCFPAVDFLQHRRLPFVVAVTCFRGARRYGTEDITRALALVPGTPVALCDARDRASGKDVLVQLIEYAGRTYTARLLDSVS